MNSPTPALDEPTPWAAIRNGVLAGVAMLALLLPPGVPGPASASQVMAPLAPAPLRMADLGDADASSDLRHMANWIANSGDHAAMPFVVIDKRAARLYVFDAQARLLDHTPVLLGSAHGDDSVPGIGDKAIADVRPEERTTPAGRFKGQRGLNIGGEDVVWVDYDAAVSMHRVRAIVPKERRLQRLASETADDNRISYGCINIPVAFFDAHIAPTFSVQRAMVYVLPEQKTLQTVFGVQAPEPAQAERAHGHLAQMIR
ncbi:hypothetical protein [Hydrogenophaga sp.]|uniref:hypothetical protein n=1 Tax=Hydrogenophaga sp. TaxID=1904254 RepID=UPI002731F5CD|nr:hypothetical protein [Hydrogenophaga sp.]MDP2017362.1 hypothetical protein [Hydrogenophaga sp.]MDP3168612.1 hypothetical protein [Hydrogenophaga sp.]MDP3812589.1 hypothetical protein [Hydrogenophaga sp.]